MNILYDTALWLHNRIRQYTFGFENFLIANAQDTINTPELPVPSFFKDELLHKYEVELLGKLEEASKIEPAEQRVMVVKEILADNWKLVQGTFLSYTSRPDDKLTLLLCDIANDISDITKQSPIEVLMPRLQTDSFHDNYPSLHEAGAPDLKEILRTHILSEDGTYLIPIKVLTELPSPLEKDKPLNNYYYDYSMSAEKTTVRPTEYSRLEAHSEDTRALFDARAQYDRMINNRDNKHLLGHLQDLIRGLYMNGAHGGLGVQENAGIGAYPAIIRFVEFYDTLEQAQKDHIPQPVREEIERVIKLASDPNINHNATENLQTCVANNSERLEKVIKAYELALTQIGISAEKHGMLLGEAKTRFDKAREGLAEAIKNKTYRGCDKLGLTRALLERFEVVPSIHSKEQLDCFLTLSASEIEAIAKNDPQLLKQLQMQFPDIESFIINTLELSDNRLKVILNIIFEEFSQKNIHNEEDLAALFMSLDPSRMRNIIESIDDDLLRNMRFYNVGKFLSPEQQEVVSNVILNKNLLDKFPEIITTAREFAYTLDHITPSLRPKFFGIMQDKLADMIVKPEDLGNVLMYLTTDEYKSVSEIIHQKIDKIVKQVKSDIDYLPIIRPGDLRNHHAPLTPELRTIVFEAMQGRWSEMIITHANLFGQLLMELSTDQRTIVIEAKQDKLPEIIKDVFGFADVLRYLTPDQRTIVFEAMKDKLVAMIANNSFNFCIASEYLSYSQKISLLNAIVVNELNKTAQYGLSYFNSTIEQSKIMWSAFFGDNKRKRDEESEEVSAEPITKKRKVERVAAAEPSVLHQYPLRSKRKALNEDSTLQQELSQAPAKRRRQG